jgi:transposase
VKGSKWVDWALEEGAIAVVRAKGRLPRRPVSARLRLVAATRRPLGAAKHSIIVSCWHMLTTDQCYRDLAGDYFARRDPRRTTKRLVAQLEALGHAVTLQGATG